MKKYFFSRFAFIYLIFVVVVTGFVSEILSCQMRKFLSESKFIHYIMGIIMIFGLIMFEGGWSLDPEDDNKAGTNWSSGNVIDTAMIAVVMFIVFYISSKSQLIPNIIFYVLVLLIYGLNTQMNYWTDRNMITEQLQSRIYLVSKILFIICMVVLLYGFMDYIMYQRAQYGKNFRWDLFFIGTRKCTSIKND
jgi:hypothetical protein